MDWHDLERPYKPRQTRAEIAQSRIKDHPELKYDGTNVYCTLCKANIPFEKDDLFNRHLNSLKHQRGTGSMNMDEFNMDLVKMLVTSRISWKCLRNSQFRLFLETYCIGSGNAPSESTLTREYLPRLFEHSLNEIRQELQNSYLWVSVGDMIDPTTEGHILVNVIVRKLNSNAPCGRPYLISCVLLNTIDGDSVAETVKMALQKLWMNALEDHKDKVLFLLTDPNPHMVNAGKHLKTSFPNLIHFTCLVYTLNNIVESIRQDFAAVDTMMLAVKRMFSKAPARAKIYHEHLPNTALPPDLKTTKWDTWISSCLFYEQHLDGLKDVISIIDAKKSSDIFRNYDQLKEDLTFIKNNFGIFPAAVTKFKYKDLTIQEFFVILNNLYSGLELVSGEIGEKVRKKFDVLFQENPSFNLMCRISRILNSNQQDVPAELGLDLPILKHLKYTLLISSDMENSFSTFKTFFFKKRFPLTDEYLERLKLVYNNEEKD